MQFNESTNGTGIAQEIDRICGSTPNTYPLKDKAARVNAALDRFSSLAMQFDGEWQFDDTNWTDRPVGVTDLVSGQQDYSFDPKALMVVKVLAKDSSGYWRELEPVSTNSQESRNIWELPPNNFGSPTTYDAFDSQIFLDPIPNYDSEDGLKVVYKRVGDRLLFTDSSFVPGIPIIFHPYLARHASLPFLVEHNLPQLKSIASLIEKDEQEIKDFFDMRDMHKRSSITTKWRSSR